MVALAPGTVERTVASVSAGRVAARKRARIAAPLVGRVTEVLARKGDKVAKDQPVIELEASEARANLAMATSAAEAMRASVKEGEAELAVAQSERDQARAAVDEVQASLLMARSSCDAMKAAADEAATHLEIARSDYERRRRLEKGVVAPEVVDRAQKEVVSWESQVAASRAHEAEAQARVGSIEAQVREARARAAGADARVASIEAQVVMRRAHAAEADAHTAATKALLEKHTIHAPFAGVLSDLWVEVGEVTNPGPALGGTKTDGSKLFEVIDLADLYVTAPVDEVDVARVAVGQEARVSLDPWPREPFTGKVVRVAPFVLDVEEQNRTVEVEVAIPPEWLARGLKPGTSADLEIVVERRSGVPRLPANVLLDGRRALAVEPGPSGELRASERDLEIGVDNWRFAEVKGGLAVGAKVIAGAEGDVHVKPGQRVEVRRVIEAP